MTAYIASFDRISRDHHIPDLAVSGDAESIAEQIYLYARPKCASRDITVGVDLDKKTAIIMAGFHIAGTAILTEQETAS